MPAGEDNDKKAVLTAKLQGKSADSSEEDVFLEANETPESAPGKPAAMPVEDDVQPPPESLDLAADTSAVGKVKAMFGMLSKFIGVKDIVNMRISLPATLLDPMSNLEFWNYMDRPDIFLQIAEPEDPVDRMLNVVKWFYSKEAKWMANKVAKPYNSVLGEQFLCHWDVMASNAADQPQDTANRVYCITEQISHHPPVSAYYYYNKSRGLSVRGVDHVCAKFTGASVKVFPGHLNKGIFVKLEKRDGEEYLCTHPSAFVNGWIKASLYVTIEDQCAIYCPKTRLKAILEYKEESFFGRAKFAIQGKIVRCDPQAESAISSGSNRKQNINLARIPEKEVLCHLNGCWKGVITYRKTPLAGSTLYYPAIDSPATLLDMTELQPLDKQVAALDDQGPYESRRIWKHVTSAIKDSRFSDATAEKRRIEDEQRQKERERRANGDHWESHWFAFSRRFKQQQSRNQSPSLLGMSPAPHRRLESNSSQPAEDEYVIKGGGDDPMEDEGDYSCGVEGKPFLRNARMNDLPWKND